VTVVPSYFQSAAGPVGDYRASHFRLAVYVQLETGSPGNFLLYDDSYTD